MSQTTTSDRAANADQPADRRLGAATEHRGGEPLIRCDSLVVGWGGRPLLPAIDLELRRGQLVAVVGRNGAGKSTWFKTLLGLIPPVAGRVIPCRKALKLSYVPQSAGIDRILPLRACDVVQQGRLRGWSFLRPKATRGDCAQCERALEDAEASDLARLPFRDLSKGQQQRVLFARMLASETEVALLDEPTAAMDLVSERAAIELLARLAHDRDMAIVVVSHAPEVATDHADRILLLDASSQTVLWGDRDEVLASGCFQRHHRVGPDESPDADAR
ncbi:MAG: metal ABC transporter ATP-binding protein [Deltaproteobacteria bacterium]|jgi:zinc transport system ATP-binding protein|nr:metal ABC transporter ATP-binding protein [Deltaproteobacteria bacterium]MBW2531619.1 metal ABC transporter ATP-binding protein [Deltaproteobacteria bacterium]